MSTGKRLAKRSILGTRVSVPLEDGFYQAGVIQASKTEADDKCNVYSILLDDKTSREYMAGQLVGPGFQSMAHVKLKSGQRVYVTYNGREVSGVVLRHRTDVDEVVLTVSNQPGQQVSNQQGGPAPTCHTVELKKKLEEVRLLESRKSARLQDQDTDYSRLADGISESRRRALSLSIDVPGSINGRKRRPSAADDIDVMDDCMAAMVLMSLSCSPKSPRLPDSSAYPHSWTSNSSSGASSWVGPRSPPSPPSHLDQQAEKHGRSSPSQDEGIEMDECVGFMEDPLPTKRRNLNKVVFQCTWPGCGKKYEICDEVERHVRIQHLGRGDSSDSDLSDREEEFYYTEIEVACRVQEDPPSPNSPAPDSPNSATSSSSSSLPSIYTSSAPTLSHLDMVRPPHEDPEYRKQLQQQRGSSTPDEESPVASPINIPQLHCTLSWQPHAYAASAPCAMVSPQKFMRLSPKSLSSSPKGSPLHRRGRSESRKCRKVYGMENRDLWCTQCKWKKACSRFVD